MIKTKKQMFTVIGAFALVMLLVGVTYAFFNYTRTGTANNIRTGRIYFNTSQNGTLNLTNLFPVASNEVGSSNDQITVRIQGDTTYTGGEEFEISLVSVNNTITSGSTEKTIPINYIASYERTPVATGETPNNIGTSSNSYFTERGSSTAVYQLNATDEVSEGKQVLVGYIPKDVAIDGTLTIKAYLDGSNIAISDTYPEGDVTHTETSGETSVEVVDYTDGTTSEWVKGRTVLTTDEWNALQNTPISFKVKAVANEGTWVKKPVGTATFDTGSVVNTKLKLLMENGEYSGQNKVNDSCDDAFTFVRVYDKPDVSNLSSVNILSSTNSEEIIYAWYDEPSPHNYQIYWYTDANTIYLNENSSSLFRNIGITFSTGFESIETNHVVDMSYMFSGIDEVLSRGYNKISNWDLSNVTNMSGMFSDCHFVDFSLLQNWNVSNVTNMSKMFANNFNEDSNDSFYVSNYHTNDASFLNGWNIVNVTNFDNMFATDIYYLFGLPLSNYTFPTFTSRPGTWDNSVVQINNRDYYSGTYVPNN